MYSQLHLSNKKISVRACSLSLVSKSSQHLVRFINPASFSVKFLLVVYLTPRVCSLSLLLKSTQNLLEKDSICGSIKKRLFWVLCLFVSLSFFLICNVFFSCGALRCFFLAALLFQVVIKNKFLWLSCLFLCACSHSQQFFFLRAATMFYFVSYHSKWF